MAAPEGFDGLRTPAMNQLQAEARSRLSEAGQQQPGDYSTRSYFVSPAPSRLSSEPNQTAAPSDTTQRSVPEPDQTASGAWGVLCDLTKGACEELTTHPGRVLVSAGVGFLSGRLIAALSEEGMRTLGRISAAATVWGLYRHGGGLLKSAENVWSGRADERDHERLRGLGASALDMTAGGLAAWGGLATSRQLSSVLAQSERPTVLSNYELSKPTIAAQPHVDMPVEAQAPLASRIAKPAERATIADLKARLGTVGSRVRDQSTAGNAPNDVFYDDNGYMHHLDGAVRPEGHGSTLHGAVHTDGHFGHDVSSHSGGGGHGGFGGGHM